MRVDVVLRAEVTVMSVVTSPSALTEHVLTPPAWETLSPSVGFIVIFNGTPWGDAG